MDIFTFFCPNDFTAERSFTLDKINPQKPTFKICNGTLKFETKPSGSELFVAIIDDFMAKTKDPIAASVQFFCDMLNNFDFRKTSTDFRGIAVAQDENQDPTDVEISFSVQEGIKLYNNRKLGNKILKLTNSNFGAIPDSSEILQQLKNENTAISAIQPEMEHSLKTVCDFSQNRVWQKPEMARIL